jgi:tetratricopeptide (TPR) repeat protein
MDEAGIFRNAEQQLSQGRYEAAFQGYSSILQSRVHRIDRHSAFTVFDIKVMERVAELAVLFGRFNAAGSLLAIISGAFARAGNIYAEHYAAVQQVSVLLCQGELAAAEKTIQKLTPRIPPLETIDASQEKLLLFESSCSWPNTTEGDRLILMVRLWLEIGRMAAAKGHYRVALAIFERAISHCTSGSHPLVKVARPSLLLAIASARLERGDIEGCSRTLEDVPGIHADRLIEMRALGISARLDLLRGSLGAAHDKLEQLLHLSAERGLQYVAAGCALDLAQVLIYLNQTREAQQLIDRFAAFAEQNNDRQMSSQMRVALDLAQSRGQSLAKSVAIAPTVSELWGAEAPDTVERSGVPPDFLSFNAAKTESMLQIFEERTIAFHWLLGRRDWESCERYLTEMTMLFSDTDSMLIKMRLISFEGTLCYYREHFGRAEQLLREAVSGASELGFCSDLWQVYRFLSWTLKRAGKAEEAVWAGEKSDELLARLSNSLQPAARAIFRLNKWTAEQEFLALQIDRVISLQTQYQTCSRWTRLQARFRLLREAVILMDRIDEYKNYIVREAHDTSSARSAARISWWRKAVRIQSCQAVLRFLVLPDRILALVFTRGAVHAGISPVTAVRLRESVSDLHIGLSQTNGKIQVEAGLTALSRDLQIEAALSVVPRSVSKLVIIPDDSLHGVPFSMIPVGSKSLGDLFTVSIGFEFAFTRKRKPPAREAFIMALPAGNQQFGSLPGVMDEAEIACSWFKMRSLRIRCGDPESGPKHICRQLEGSAYLHIACHGTFSPDKPQHSGFVLIAPNGTANVLTIRDLAQSDLTAVRLAMLTSCWGADSFVLPGRFVISLPETMWRSGADTVVACLWPVPDDAMATLVRSFYRNLETLTPAEALRSSQQEMRDKLPDPLCWAGFQVYGN